MKPNFHQRLPVVGVILGLIAGILFPAVGPVKGAADYNQMIQIVKDPHFQEGFFLLHPHETAGARVVDRLTLGDNAAVPQWRLAQWSSKFNLAGTEVEILDDGSARYENEAKVVIVGTPQSDNADMILRVHGSVEYPERARTQNEPWAHLLVEQTFDVQPSLDQLESLNFHIETLLHESELHVRSGYSPSLHAAQFLVYFTVQNLNPRSPGFGDYYWFGIPVYDNRHVRIPRYQSRDFNTTGKYIFTPGTVEYTNELPQRGQWFTITKDLLPLMLEGFEASRALGYLADSGDLSDYRVSGMNLGWEVPGPFDVEMQVRNLSVHALMKE